ncbi:helix-turn-helix domain-containing protein [Streptomyces xiamenensis]|uniref:helix-turn-helix domain-containing protein n=1 Tax=Streptomyces xiamenensis TaxID=408015 RepID=UPI0037CD23CF
MAPRQQPTIRQRRFGAELRRLRMAAKMSAPAVADLLGTDRTVISNVEAGRFGISEERLRRLTSIYRCGDSGLVDALAAMTGGRNKGWWGEYRGKVPPDFLDISELEASAARLRTMQTAHLPGLFQTEDHARALFNLTDPPLSRLDVELRVAHRLARQDVVAKDAVPYVGLIHEAALRMLVGGRDVAKRQIDHLLEASEWENVTLLVIPFSVGEFPMMGESVLYAEGRSRALDTVHMDSPAGAFFVDSPESLTVFRRKLDVIERMALPAAGSRDLIRSIGREM